MGLICDSYGVPLILGEASGTIPPQQFPGKDFPRFPLYERTHNKTPTQLCLTMEPEEAGEEGGGTTVIKTIATMVIDQEAVDIQAKGTLANTIGVTMITTKGVTILVRNIITKPMVGMQRQNRRADLGTTKIRDPNIALLSRLRHHQAGELKGALLRASQRQWRLICLQSSNPPTCQLQPP